MKYSYNELINFAVEAGMNSYSPYSKFRVGAALLTASGKVFTGCNIENRSYSPTVCAERVAIFKAVSESESEIIALAVVGLDCDYPLPPCGVCRQVLSEFSKSAIVIMAGRDTSVFKATTILELLPFDALDDLRV